MSSRCSIVPLRERHLRQVVQVHLRSFPGFFLSFLGPKFVREFYQSFLHNDSGVGFVAEQPNGDVVGVVVGPLNPEGHFLRLVKRRWWAFFAASLVALARKPRIASRLMRAVRYRGEPPLDVPRSLLSSIAVAPKMQGDGIGHLLIKAWVDEVRRLGSSGCYLTTDSDDNDSVNDFYRSHGWTLNSRFTTPEGRRMNRYVLDFSTSVREEGKKYAEALL